MGKDGDTTISALKGATQINSNSLFDHGAGTPSVVRMSDFLVSNLSGVATGSDPLYGQLCRVWAVNSTRRFGSYNNDFWQFNDSNFTLKDQDSFSWVIEADAPGRFYIPQIGSLQVHWDFATTNAVVNDLTELTDNGSIIGILVECTVDSPGSAVEVFLQNYSSPFNIDIPNYDANFVFRTEDVENNTAQFTATISATSINNSGGIDLSWNISDGQTPYDYAIDRQPRDKSTGTVGSYTQILSGTYNTTPISDSYSDDNLDDSNDYRYRIDVNDGGGTQETDETAFIFVTQ